VHFVFVDKT